MKINLKKFFPPGKLSDRSEYTVLITLILILLCFLCILSMFLLFNEVMRPRIQESPILPATETVAPVASETPVEPIVPENPSESLVPTDIPTPVIPPEENVTVTQTNIGPEGGNIYCLAIQSRTVKSPDQGRD